MAGQFPEGTSPEKQAMFNRQGEELSIYLALVRSGGLKLSDDRAMHLAVMMWCAKNQESTPRSVKPYNIVYYLDSKQCYLL